MVPDLAISPDGPEIRQLIDAAGPMAMVVGFDRRIARHRFYNVGVLGRGRRSGSCPPEGVSADLRAVRRAAILRRRRPVHGLRHGAVRPRGDPGLRGFLAPVRGGHHAGRRGRPVDLCRQFASTGASTVPRSASPKPTSNSPRPMLPTAGRGGRRGEPRGI